MKANELVKGQKYIWRRNSSVSHEVTYLGFNDSGKFPMYEFEYLREGEKMRTLLSVYHVDSDIIQVPEDLKAIYYKLGEVINKIEPTQYNYIIDCGKYVLYKKGDEPKQIQRFDSVFALDAYCISNNIY